MLDLYPAITTWVSAIPEVFPAQSLSNPDAEPWNEVDPLPALNSTYRSTLELLVTPPPLSHLEMMLPFLPTHISPSYEYSEALPHEILNPLPESVLQSNPPNSLEMEYTKLLDLRERLRVEEIISEIQPDMQQLFLDPVAYLASQKHLRNVRILIIEVCQALTYIESKISLHNINLDLSAIDQRRICQRPSNHPYIMISNYLKPTAWQQLNNYTGFFSLGLINGGIGLGDWEALSSTLDSEYSRFLGPPDKYLQPMGKQVDLFETYCDVAANHYWVEDSWGAVPGVVEVFA